MEEENDYLKLSIEERCQHKLWKARISGYEDATKLFQQADEKSPDFLKYLGLVKKFVTDSNAIAQEKGLATVLAFVENGACAGKSCGEVMNGIVTKCLGAPKARTKELAFEIILMYIEIERQEIVQDELIKGLESKSPKVVSACVTALRESLHSFGSQVITIKPLVKVLPKLLEDRDKVVREETKALCVEIYRWVGEAIKPQLQTLKPLQLTELESDFAKVRGERAVPTRYLKSQQETMAKRSQEVANSEELPPDECDRNFAQPQIDPYDLMDPVDILSKLPKDFYEQCEAKKWQERKEAMESLLQLTSNIKLEAGDYGDLVRVLKKILAKDTNVLVVALAGKCLANLVVGLRKKFLPYSGHCVPVILEKFKEKKQNVVQALREAIDAIYQITTLESLIEDIQSALDSKNPQVRAETAAFLTRCFTSCTPVQLSKKILKPLCISLVKTLNDTDVSVRDFSAEALGTALKVTGERVMAPFLQDVDALKMAKVKDCCDKAVITAKAQPVESKPTTAKSALSVTATKTSSNAETSTKISITGGAKKSASAPTIKPKAHGGVRIGNKAMNIKKGIGDTAEPEFTEKELSDEEVAVQATAVLSEDVMNGLNSSNWKERLAAVEKFNEIMQQVNKDSIPAQALVKVLARKPGFKENNFQILKLRFEILVYIIQNAPISHCTINCCLSDVVDKIGDNKNGMSASTALTAFAEATSLEYIGQEVLHLAFSQKNPRNQAESLIWLSNAVKEFGLKIQVKEMIDTLKKAFSSTNPAVRTSALSLLSTLYLYIGKSLRTFFEDEKPALLQQIDAELEKVKDAKPPLPERGLGPKGQSLSLSSESGEVGKGSTNVNIADLVPRTDISNQITTQLLTELSDKNWKVRAEALQKASTIINEAKFITPNLGDFPSALKQRLTDTNKNLAVQALSICQMLGTALGPHCPKQIRNFITGMLPALGDSKANVRSAALQSLNCWMEHCPLSSLFEGETVSDALRSDNPFLRIELFSWLAEKLPTASSVPVAELNLCIPYLLNCVEDRNSEVRKKANECLLPFMIHVGFESMSRAAGKLKPASKNSIMSQLEKVRQNLPEKPTKPRSGPAKGAVGRASPPSPVGANDGTDDNANVPAGKGRLNRSTSKSKLTLKANSATTKSKKEEEVDTSPPLVANNMKDQRLIDEKSLKVLRWNFTNPREEFYIQLKEQMIAANWGRTLVSNCFHNDFKFHIKAIDILIECLGSNVDATAANLDLILKWLALRFFDTNPSVLIKGLEYLQMLFEVLIGLNYRLLEAEAASFVPYLILKIGDPKDAVRKGVREIIKLMCQIYPASKMFSYIMQGLSSKNARQRAECLEELGFMIELYGLSVCQPTPAVALKEIARQIADRDNSVRNASLNCVVQAYFIEGEKVYKYVGQLADKDMSLLEERIKRSAKGRIPLQRELQRESGSVPQVNKTSPPSQHAVAQSEGEIRMTKGRIPRPRSTGPLTLDVDDIEQMFKSEEPESKLPEPVEVNADDILNLPDIQLPQTRLRPPASAVKLLNSSAEATTALNLVMAQLTAQEIPVVVEAFAQVEEVLRQDDRAEAVMGSRVDQLLVMGALQYRLAHNKHMADENICKADVIRLYRCVTMALVSLFDHKSLAKKASRDVLRDLIPHLITVMLDTRLNELQEGPQVVRAINVLIVRILQRSNPTHVMSALIKLLHDCVGSMNVSERFTELVMKCIWKMLRMMGQYIEELNIDRILLDLHVFLKAYPSSSWKDRPSDTPIRTIKTILYTLVSYKGEDIIKHLMLIPNRQESDLANYLQKLLNMRKDGDHKTKDRSSKTHADAVGNSGNKKLKSSPLKLSKSTHEALTEIFRKIGSKEQTKEGLLELYEFRQRHPEANIEPFLQRSSEFFQNYIRQGIKAIEQERATHNIAQDVTSSPIVNSPDIMASKNSDYQMGTWNLGAETVCSNNENEKGMTEALCQGFPPLPPCTADTSPMDWVEFLKIVIARLGMDTTKYDDPAFLQELVGNTSEKLAENDGRITEQVIADMYKDIERHREMLADLKKIKI